MPKTISKGEKILNTKFTTITDIISDFNSAEDRGDVEAINNNLKDLYSEMEYELHFICREVNSDRLDYFKDRYFPKND